MRRTQPACLPACLCRSVDIIIVHIPFSGSRNCNINIEGPFSFVFSSLPYFLRALRCIIYHTHTYTYSLSLFPPGVVPSTTLRSLYFLFSPPFFLSWFRHLPAYLPNHPSPSFRLTLPDASSLAHIILLIYFRRKRPIRP